MARRRLVVSCIVAGAVLTIAVSSSGASGAAPAPPRFTTPVQLNGAAGGEPSIANDPQDNVYVLGPQGIPAGANGEPGVGFWRSSNDATSFGTAQHIGSFAGGGDSDAVVTPNGDLYVADLEAAATQVCRSSDHGATFTGIGPIPDPTSCSVLNTGQAGPSNDRQWLTTDRKGELYLTYHEFVSAQPLVFRDDKGGQDLFTDGPCGSIVTDPTIEQNVPTDLTGGTLVSKPVTDAAGNLYILFTTTTQAENAAAVSAGQVSGTFSQVYMAVSTDHCATFTDYTVFDGSKVGTNTVQFGNIFNALAIDGAGNLYAVAAGYVGTTPYAKTSDIYLFSSTDHGKTWRGPTKLGPAGAHSLPAAVGGPVGGELAIGYFRTVNGVTNPNDTKGVWTYGTAESGNAATSNPAWSYADVRPGFIYHSGEICSLGILCGAVPGGSSDRSLLDFTAAAIDTRGCPLFTFAGNPKGVDAGTFNYVTRQTSSCLALPAAAQTPAPAPGTPAPAPGTRASALGTTDQSGRDLAFTGLTTALPVAALVVFAMGGGLFLVRRRAAGRR